jgi:hypothetical protein
MRNRLEIPPGINTDDTAYKYPGTWHDCDQVRFWKGSPEVVGGWESVSTDLLDGVCRSALTWFDNNSNTNIALGQHNALTICQDSTLYDITPASGFTPGAIDGTGGSGYGTGTYGTGDYSEPSSVDYFPLTWSLANYGESLMANPRGQTIFWWQNDTGTPAAALTNAPDNVTFMLVTYTRQVMALGCNEELSGDFNPMCIRFTDLQDPEQWTTASDNNAGEVILEGGGRIVGAEIVGDYVFVWTNNSIFQGVFSGDNVNPWVFTKLGDNCGLIGANAAAVVSQTAYWFSTQGRFFSCSLGGVPTIIPIAVGDDMAANVASSQGDKIVGASLSRFNEVWWFYPDARDGIENSRYVTLSLTEGASSKGTIARTAFSDVTAGINVYPIGVTYGGNIYYHEKGTTADGAARSWFIETSDFFIDEEQRCMMVNRMWPDFQRQTGAIMMTLRGLQYPQSTPVVFSDQILTANTTKIDFRFSGRLIRMRLSGNTTPSDMRLGIPTFDVMPAGDR